MGWKDIAADKKERIANSIPKEWRIDTSDLPSSVIDYPAQSGILSKEELAITNSTAVDLVQKLATGQVKSVDVTLAFCKRAALAHQLVCGAQKTLRAADANALHRSIACSSSSLRWLWRKQRNWTRTTRSTASQSALSTACPSRSRINCVSRYFNAPEKSDKFLTA